MSHIIKPRLLRRILRENISPRSRQMPLPFTKKPTGCSRIVNGTFIQFLRDKMRELEQAHVTAMAKLDLRKVIPQFTRGSKEVPNRNVLLQTVQQYDVQAATEDELAILLTDIQGLATNALAKRDYELSNVSWLLANQIIQVLKESSNTEYQVAAQAMERQVKSMILSTAKRMQK